MNFSQLTQEPLVLASQSSTRLRLLQGAGLSVQARPAHVDEAALKQALRAQEASPAQAAETLADAKGLKISRAIPQSLVIAADQILVCGSVWFDKPGERDQAFAQLTALSGKQHSLFTGASLWREGQRLWHTTQEARLWMRELSPADLETYLDQSGEAIFHSVGAYHLEGLGARLFTRVEGDFFSIQGLPLVELLAVLSRQEASFL